MKLYFTITILIVSLFQGAAQDNQKTVKSNITDVTVFLSGAQVTRNGSVNINPGTSLLVFEGLPQNINTQSIQVSGKGNFTILSVIHQMNYLNQEKLSKDIKALLDTLESMEDLQKTQNSMVDVYTNELSMLDANKTVGGLNVGMKVIDLKEAVDFYRTRSIELKTKLIALNKKIEKLNERISTLSMQINELDVKKNAPTGEVVVTVTSKESVNAALTLSYLVYDAGWVPFYDLRAIDVNNPIDLYYKANVYQSSGEDWKNIPITLSTGNPSQSGTKPELNTWYLSFYYNNYNYHKYDEDKENKMVMKKEMAAEDNYAETQKDVGGAKSSVDYTVVTESQTSVEFKIDIPYTIPSDGKYTVVDVQKFSLPAFYEYRSAPKLDKDAFLMAGITGWENYNLLSGEMNLFFEGAYVGKSSIDTRITKDTLSISLGRDKSISVTRDKQKDFSSKKTIGLNQKETFAWLISVKNKKKQAVKMVIEDQFPISTNKDIEVERLDFAEGKVDDVTGKVLWNFELKPAESKAVKISYSVKYPKNETVIIE